MGGFMGGRAAADASKNYAGRWTAVLVIGTLSSMGMGWSYGYDLGITGGVTGMKTFRNYFGFPASETTSMWCKFVDPYLSLVASTAYIASVPATFVAFWLCGWRGRMATIFLGATAYCVAAGLQAGSVALAMLYVGRAVVGVGMALGNQASPVYLSEVAPPKFRGGLVSFYQLAVVVGILCANLVNYGTGKASWDGWRISLGVFAAPLVLVLLAAPFLPDSPDSMISRGQQGKARKALERIRGTPDVEEEWADMLEETQGTEAKKRALMAHFSSRRKFERSQFHATLKWAWRYRVHFTLCFILGAFRALTGNPLLLFWAPELFQTLGTSQNYSLLSAVVQGCAKLLGNVLCICLVDRVGRKSLQLVGGVGQLLMQVAAALITGVWYGEAGTNDADAWVLTIVLCLFEVFFELSIATLSWVVATEICPLEVRTIGSGFHVMGDLCLQVFFAQMNLTMMCHMEYGVFILSAGFCVLFLLFSMFLIPETKGVPLDKIQELLRQHWLWKPFMKELQEAADREAAEAEAAAAAKGLPMESAASGASGARTPGEPAGLGAKAA